jgi:hypothetical protein
VLLETLSNNTLSLCNQRGLEPGPESVGTQLFGAKRQKLYAAKVLKHNLKTDPLTPARGIEDKVLAHKIFNFLSAQNILFVETFALF